MKGILFPVLTLIFVCKLVANVFSIVFKLFREIMTQGVNASICVVSRAQKLAYKKIDRTGDAKKKINTRISRNFSHEQLLQEVYKNPFNRY